MEKTDAYIESWIAENVDRFRGLASSDFNEQYNAKQIFIAEVKKLVKAILEASDYQLTLLNGGQE